MFLLSLCQICSFVGCNRPAGEFWVSSAVAAAQRMLLLLVECIFPQPLVLYVQFVCVCAFVFKVSCALCVYVCVVRVI